MPKRARRARPKKEPLGFEKNTTGTGVYNFRTGRQKSMYRTDTQTQSGTGATRNIPNKRNK